MSNELRKITFEDKEDLINLNSDSNKILTAANINEIKDVVNNLIDNLDVLTCDKVFKYIRFNVPKGLIDNTFYSLKIELSTNKNFSIFEEINCYPTLIPGEINYLLEEDQNSIFSILFKNLILTKDDEDSEIKINIENYLKNENNIPFFGRYKLINLTNSVESQWYGFTLGFSTYKDDEYFNRSLKEVKIVRTN